MHRLVCLGWISTPEGKDNFSFETQVAHSEPSPTSTALLDVISDAAVTQWLLGTNANAQRNSFRREARPQFRAFANIGARISLTSLTFKLIRSTGNCRFHVREILSFLFSTPQRQNDMDDARVTSSLQNPTSAEHEIFRTHVSACRYTIKFTVNS
jgi:hypothetical protein